MNPLTGAKRLNNRWELALPPGYARIKEELDMSVRKTKLVLAAMAVVALVVPATAQETKPMGLSIKAGIVFPTSSYGRDVGNSWFGVGAEYKLKDMAFGTMDRAQGAHLSLSADWYGKGEASSFPVMLNYVATQNEMYWMAGAGLAFTRDDDAGSGNNKTSIAYGFGVGYNFQSGQNPFFVEARYLGSGRSQLNVFGAYVGVRL